MSPLSRNPRDTTIQLRDIQRWGRCRGSLRGRSHGRHVDRPSLDRCCALSQGFRSVRSCSALLFGDRPARYVVMVWSGVDVLSNLLRVVRGAVVYPGKKDHHKQVITENTEGHRKGKLIRILFSVHFGGFRG